VVAPGVGVSDPHVVRDAASASAEWLLWYVQYVTRTASQSARTLDLSSQVLECVARGHLTPAAIDAALRELAATRGDEYTSGLTDLTERFVHGLAEVMSGRSNGPSERTGPTSRGPVDVGPVLLDRPSSASTALFHQIMRLYADVLGDFDGLRTREIEECFRTLLASATATARDASHALALTAALGDTASASIIVENSGTERLMVRCAATDVRRTDGVGPAFVPTVALAPDEQTLEPGQEARVRASLWLDAAVYEPDVLYVGALRVMRERSPHVDVPLRITATRGSR
jgi:hypothetical protein